MFGAVFCSSAFEEFDVRAQPGGGERRSMNGEPRTEREHEQRREKRKA
jgi:hypothetical protein